MRTNIVLSMAVLVALLASCGAQAIAENELLVTAAGGEVSVLKLDKWVPAATGMRLEMGDSVKTGKASFCDVNLGENSFRVKENSLFTVADIMKNIELQLEYGSILTKIKKLPPESRFEVKTPQAVIGARGTRYKVYAQRQPAATCASALENAIICGCRNDAARSVMVMECRTTEISPWETAVIRARGTGILSEKILGELEVKKLKSGISIRAAGDTREKALRNLANELFAVYLDGEKTIGDVLTENDAILKKVYRYIAGAATFSEPKHGTVEAEIALGPVSEILGREISVVSDIIQPITEDEYAERFGALARVTTRRAAAVDGYRNLAETIYGAVVDSETTVEDYVAKDDTIKSRITGIVQGAREVGIKYFSDGSISVVLETEARRIKDELSPYTGAVFGAYYIAKPAVISIEDFEDYLVD